jgi:transcription elongation factor Elf1
LEGVWELTFEHYRSKPKKIAYLSCRICTTSYQKPITRLTKEVDVYCDWIDEANELAKGKKSGRALGFQGDDD